MIKFREYLSPNLCYDLSNATTEEDKEKFIDLTNTIVNNLVLINIDYMVKKKENIN
jgi:hypothetical protein